MPGGATGTAVFDHSLAERRARLAGPSGFRGLIHNPRVFFIAFYVVASLGGLLYGYQGVFSGVLTMTSFDSKFASTVNDSGLKGFVTSILELGAWVGCLHNSFMSDWLGRRLSMVYACLWFILGVGIQAGARTPAWLYSGRFITGIGVGALSVGVPLYNGEVAPAEVRGSLVTLQQLSIEFGIMISFWIDYGTNYMGGTGDGQSEASWRLPLALQVAPCIVLLCGLFLLPESPRWLVAQDRSDEALRVLAKLRRQPAESELVQIEYLEIRAQHLFDQETTRELFPHLQEPGWKNNFLLGVEGWKKTLFNGANFRRVATGALIMFFQQWNGINAVLYYAPTIFKSLGLTGNTVGLLATGVVGIVMLLATFPTVMYLDKIGRRPILIGGALVMGTCHLLIAILSGLYEDSWPDHKGVGWFACVLVWIYAVGFGFSWGPVAWVYVSEVFPLAIRSKGVSAAGSSNWMNNFIVGETTPSMMRHMRFGTYIFFGFWAYAGAVYVWLWAPETKGRTLEEMDEVFRDKSKTSTRDRERIARINREIGLTGWDGAGPGPHTGAGRPQDKVLEQSDSEKKAVGEVALTEHTEMKA